MSDVTAELQKLVINVEGWIVHGCTETALKAIRKVRENGWEQAETPTRRNDRLSGRRDQTRIETLLRLIADLSGDLCDEGRDYSVDSLNQMRRRVANALPPDMCPDWLATYRDPPVVQS